MYFGESPCRLAFFKGPPQKTFESWVFLYAGGWDYQNLDENPFVPRDPAAEHHWLAPQQWATFAGFVTRDGEGKLFFLRKRGQKFPIKLLSLSVWMVEADSEMPIRCWAGSVGLRYSPGIIFRRLCVSPDVFSSRGHTSLEYWYCHTARPHDGEEENTVKTSFFRID